MKLFFSYKSLTSLMSHTDALYFLQIILQDGKRNYPKKSDLTMSNAYLARQ